MWKTNSKGQRYEVHYKNVYTKGKWKKEDDYTSLSVAGAKADYLKNQKFIMGKDWTGAKRPSPKTQTKIVRKN